MAALFLSHLPGEAGLIDNRIGAVMRYKIGDSVVHLAHGLGQIVNLEEKRLFGAEARLYYEVVTQKNTVWVPVESQAGSTLRSITSKSDLGDFERVLKLKPEPLNKDHRMRQSELNERLKRGSFQALCEVVRDLTAHGWRKPLSDADAALLRRIYENLCQEWAMAAGLAVTEVDQQISRLLLEAKHAHQA
jgi:RNA polymerase-interacting CarD/CdnL/TRCF family regulator